MAQAKYELNVEVSESIALIEKWNAWIEAHPETKRESEEFMRGLKFAIVQSAAMLAKIR